VKLSRSLVDIISTADPAWINGTRIDRLPDGTWQVSAPSRFQKGAFAIETNPDLAAALRDAWGPYGTDEAEPVELSAAELEE
jgi:hypothetical protein